MKLAVQYRGPLASCNYGCAYCPFAKRRDGSQELATDRAALARFLGWAKAQPDVDLSVLFTPWGGALTRRWYRDAMVELSHLAHVRLVAAQTNLSRTVSWTSAADPGRLKLWCTFHPSEADLAAFLGRCADLDRLGISHSVGIVGFPSHLPVARELRTALPPSTYVWVNPASGLGRPYTPAEIEAWTGVDPLFPVAVRPHRSLGRPCRAGEAAITIDGDGAIRRCHFVSSVIGNIADPNWRDVLRSRLCPNQTCNCFIGYVHRDAELYDGWFGDTLLARIPVARAGISGPTMARPLAADTATSGSSSASAPAAAARSGTGSSNRVST